MHIYSHLNLMHALRLLALCGRTAAWESDSKWKKKLWRVSYLFRCHWGGASYLSLSFPLSFPSFFSSLSLPVSLVPTCSLKSCSPPVVFRQSKDKIEICWEQWTVRQFVFVCMWLVGVDVKSLKLFLPCPNRLEARPSPFNPLMLHHSLTHKQSTLIRLLRTHLTHSRFKIHLELHAQLAIVEVVPLCLRTVPFLSFHIYWLVKVTAMALNS